MSTDSDIREQLKKRQLLEERKLQNRMEEEEEELKQYFKDIQKPVKTDPTLVRRQRYNEKMATYRDVISDISLKGMVKSMWFYEANTPEEIETLYDCKEFLKYRCLEGLAMGLSMTSFISFWNKRYLSYTAIGMGVGVGIFSGVATGFLRSTSFILSRLEALGSDYTLGRMAINEIEDFRLDKVIKNNI